jgi:CheY-like chemotaxis protein
VTSSPPSGHVPLVLIVDDNEKNRRLAREVLRADGLRTIEAASGGAGIASPPSGCPT